LGDLNRVEVLDLEFQFLGLLGVELTGTDRPAFAVTIEEQDPIRAFLISTEAGHC